MGRRFAGKGSTQERINRDKLVGSDLVVMLIWKRWGSPTGEYSSGFEEEYELAMSAKKDILLYFRSIPKQFLDNPDPQVKRVLAFRSKVKSENRLLVHEYKDADEWERRFTDHLYEWLDRKYTDEGREPLLEILFEKTAQPYCRKTEAKCPFTLFGENIPTDFRPADTTTTKPIPYPFSPSYSICMNYRLVKVKNIGEETARKCKVKITVSRDDRLYSPLIDGERVYCQWDIQNADKGNEPQLFDLDPSEEQAITICHTEEDRSDILFFDDQGKISNARQANPFRNGTYYVRVHAYSKDRVPSKADFIITKGEGYDSLDMERITSPEKDRNSNGTKRILEIPKPVVGPVRIKTEYEEKEEHALKRALRGEED